MSWWQNLRSKYEKTVEEYGKAAIGTYLVLFFGTWIAFWLSIRFGLDTSGAAASAGTIGGAWVLTKATQPVRILATVVITPAAVALWHRVRPAPPDPKPTAEP